MISVYESLHAIRTTYDAVASRYAQEFADDLAGKVLDRAMLAAFAELAGRGAVVADLGCGPGFEAKHLADLGLEIIGIDLSTAMIAEARRRHPAVARLEFRVGSLLDLPFADASLAGAIAIYSVIHLGPAERAQAYHEMGRVVRPGGPLLLSVHISGPSFPAGSTRHMTEWWGQEVSLDGHFIDPAEVTAGLVAAGFVVDAILERGPSTPQEFPSRRAYLLARRAAG